MMPPARLRLLVIGLFLASATLASAQVSLRLAASGPTLTAAGSPFEVHRVTRVVLHLAGGAAVTRESHETLLRDADGRVLDKTVVVPATGSTASPKTFYVLADPVKKFAYEWADGAPTAVSYPLTNVSHINISVLDLPREKQLRALEAKETVTTEQLGTRTFAGLNASGIRTIGTLPAAAISSDRPLVWKHEVWTSTELKLTVSEDEDNPLLGTRHSEITSIERSAPAAASFELPAGLHVVESPMANGSMMAKAEYEKMLEQLANPDLREVSAMRLIAYAKSHPEVQNHVAKELAVRDTHLDEATALEQQALDRVERDSGAVSGSQITATDLRRMQTLALYWDTMGWILAAQGDLPGARRYYQDAWQLSGEGLYLAHIARLDEQAGDRAAAVHRLEIALGGKMDASQQEQTKKTLARLGVADPQPTPEPVAIPVAVSGAAAGDSEIYLVFVAGQPPRVRLKDDQPAPQALAKSLRAAAYPEQMPAGSQAYVIREAKLTCTAASCTARLLPAWEAVQQASPSVTLGSSSAR